MFLHFNSLTRPKFFYGYVIFALCFVNMVVMRGVNGAFSVYYLALLETFSWSHSVGASVASINFLVYALAAPLVGLIFDRLGPRLLSRWAMRIWSSSEGRGIFIFPRSSKVIASSPVVFLVRRSIFMERQVVVGVYVINLCVVDYLQGANMTDHVGVNTKHGTVI